MPALIRCQNLSKAYGVEPLFTDLTLGISEKDRMGIIGPNGSGKTTLLKILAGLEQADRGSVIRRQLLRIAYVPQQSEFDPNATVGETIERAGLDSGLRSDECLAQVQEILGKMGFQQGNQLLGPLSGGWKKRLAIACGVVQNPDILLLDEPTNHLDLEGLRWFEQLMSQAPWSWVMVSHDRWFLEHVTNTVAEMNSRYPDGIFLVAGTYSKFFQKREEYLNAQTQQARSLAGKVRRETEWLQRGPKARTTKAKYRVDTAHELQDELARTTARLRQDETGIDFVGSGRKTKRLIVAEGLCKTFGPRTLIQDLDMTLTPGMALGILGHNGSGKSTLLKLLAGEWKPDQGSLTHADSLQLVYFDQHREHLNPKMTLRRTLSDTGHTVTYRGRTIHLAGWAKRFRFQPEQLDLPIERLSGGEQARALMARLMLRAADVLFVDEPTNDLDIPAREVLEDSLKEFPGALVLVTHDRFMLEEICTQFLGLDGTGGYGQFADIRQWETWLQDQRSRTGKAWRKPSRIAPPSKRTNQPKRLSYKEQQEYDTLEERILEAEGIVETCRARTEDPAVATDQMQIQEAYEALQAAEREVGSLYARWAELETKLQTLNQHRNPLPRS